MRVLERICLVVALAGCAFLLLERFEVIDLQSKSKRRERARLVADLEKELTSSLTARVRDAVEAESTALRTRVAGDVERKVSSEIVPALKAELTRELGSGGPSDTLTARELNITNEAGKVVIRLSANASGGGDVDVSRNDGRRVARLHARSDHDGEVALYDEDGVLRANMGGNDTGGYSNFWDRSGGNAVYVGADGSQDAGYITIYGPGDKKLVELSTNAGGGDVSTRGLASGKVVATLGALPTTGAGYLGIGSAEGKVGSAIYTTADGGNMKVFNSDGKTAGFMGVSAEPAGNGLFYVSDTKGQRLLEAGATTKGGGYVSINNSKAERVIFVGSSTGTAPDDGVLEVARDGGKLGVVLRGYSGGSSLRVYDVNEKVTANIR